MGLIWDGSSEHFAHVWRSFPKFDDSFDVTKCLQVIEIPVLIHMFAPCSELPSNNRTMTAGLYDTLCICLQSNGSAAIEQFDIKTIDTICITPMVPILDGNSEHFSHGWRKIGLFWEKKIYDCSRSNQMPYTEYLAEIYIYVFDIF